jgi:hypothetical protein
MQNWRFEMTKAPRFVVYHIKSTMEKNRFYREHDARNLVIKLNAAQSDWERNNIGGYAVATVEHYKTQVVHMVTRVNLMSGKEYQEASNTPNYLSPASEAYWSM